MYRNNEYIAKETNVISIADLNNCIQWRYVRTIIECVIVAFPKWSVVCTKIQLEKKILKTDENAAIST